MLNTNDHLHINFSKLPLNSLFCSLRKTFNGSKVFSLTCYQWHPQTYEGPGTALCLKTFEQ